MKAPGATWTWLNRQNNMEAMHNKTNMKSTMCWTAGNTHFCTCSCGHGGLEVTKAWVIAPVGHIPEVVLVALVYVTGPGSDPVKNWDASLCIPNSWRTARWTHLFLLPCCNLGAFGLAALAMGVVPSLGPLAAGACNSIWHWKQMSADGNVSSLAYHQPWVLVQPQQGYCPQWQTSIVKKLA